ncbi:MAG TPA: hypothetical protein VFW87_03920 [Pirellulales bacterium]|nr:hypothetical protein [Pirellulales bacterium]
MKAILCCACLLLAGGAARAGDCCQHCGRHTDCCKVCRVVCEMTKVSKPEFECECEDFCVPGPSQCETVCDDCGNKCRVYTPGCAKVRTRVKLVRKEVVQEKPSYKWVVEDVCCKCAAKLKVPADPAQRNLAVLPASASMALSTEDADENNESNSKFDIRRILHLSPKR